MRSSSGCLVRWCGRNGTEAVPYSATEAVPYVLTAVLAGAAGASGCFVHTGSTASFEPAMAVGLSDAWPQATSSGSFAKSTMQPSRLKQLWSYVEPMKMQSTGHGSTHSAQNMHLV